MDSQQALQTYGKFFLILESFYKLTTIFNIIVAVDLCRSGGGGICADHHAF